MSSLFLFFTDVTKPEGKEGLVWDRDNGKIASYSHFIEVNVEKDGKIKLPARAKRQITNMLLSAKTGRYLTLRTPAGKIGEEIDSATAHMSVRERIALHDALDAFKERSSTPKDFIDCTDIQAIIERNMRLALTRPRAPQQEKTLHA